jgi:PST family polysaccharide transporter
MQKMKFVTFVNLSLRLLSVPFVFIFVKSPADLLKYTLIVSALPVLGGFFTFFYLQIKEKITIKFVALKNLKPIFKDALPFFGTSIFSTSKIESGTVFVGAGWRICGVALLDLANKLVIIPRMITNNINIVLFPNIVQNYSLKRIKKIINYEKIIGIINTLIIVAVGYWVVLIFGGKNMLAAYPLSVILSFTIYAWLIVGCYVNFLFVPQNKYNFITKNQFTALVSFLIFAVIALLIGKNIIIIVSAYVLSHVVEIFYCKFLIKKHKLI